MRDFRPRTRSLLGSGFGRTDDPIPMDRRNIVPWPSARFIPAQFPMSGVSCAGGATMRARPRRRATGARIQSATAPDDDRGTATTHSVTDACSASDPGPPGARRAAAGQAAVASEITAARWRERHRACMSEKRIHVMRIRLQDDIAPGGLAHQLPEQTQVASGDDSHRAGTGATADETARVAESSPGHPTRTRCRCNQPSNYRRHGSVRALKSRSRPNQSTIRSGQLGPWGWVSGFKFEESGGQRLASGRVRVFLQCTAAAVREARVMMQDGIP